MALEERKVEKHIYAMRPARQGTGGLGATLRAFNFEETCRAMAL